MGALLLLAFLVRWLPALVPHFWLDEVYTVSLIHQPPLDILKITAGDSHPPLYYYWVKCFAILGLRLGGPFATLAWLRLASILPGVLTCLLAWWLARRVWGRRRALWALALFAVSPALTYYSVDLRNYSLSHCLLLAGLIGLLGAAARERAPRWPGLPFFTLSMLLAFYVHSLNTFYLAVCALLFLVEMLLDPARRTAGLRRGAAAAGLLALGCIPWIKVMSYQTGLLNQAKWLGWANWRDLPLSLLWYLPLGPWLNGAENRRWAWVIMALIGLGLLLLAASAFRQRGGSPPDADPALSRRLLAYSGALTYLPLLGAFVLSHDHVAKVFLGYRYNLLAAPFFNLLLLGLLFRIPRPRWRAGLLAGVLLASAAASGCVLWQRVTLLNDYRTLGARHPELLQPGNRFYWMSAAALPWLGRCGPIALGSYASALKEPAALAAGGDAYLFLHTFQRMSGPFAEDEPLLIEKILLRRGVEQLSLKGVTTYSNIWHLRPQDSPAIARDLAAVRQAIEARRRSISGGQMLLADDPAFREGRGWSCLELTEDLMPVRWTQGPRQSLAWSGPKKPGRYHLKMSFWRSHPYPEPELALRWRLPGQPAWQTRKQAGVGPVVIEGDVTVKRPRQPLTLELEIPTWVPAERLPGNDDPRPLGILFTGAELRPAAKPAK